jgi:hypothetical protein
MTRSLRPLVAGFLTLAIVLWLLLHTGPVEEPMRPATSDSPPVIYEGDALTGSSGGHGT